MEYYSRLGGSMSLVVDHGSAQNLIGLHSNIGSETMFSLSHDVAPPLAASSTVKRAFDVCFSLSVLITLLPVLLLIAIAIKIDSRGPVFFKQVRWGRNQKPIHIYKFRSMRTDMCDATGVAQTVSGDPRITRLGAFLRKSSLDELPQFINVLRGDMSVVGPRCHAIGMLAAGQLYEHLVPEYHQRHYVRPGITGLAQVRGWRGPTTDAVHAKARIACDIYYIRKYSLWLDIKIIVGTIRNELKGGTGL